MKRTAMPGWVRIVAAILILWGAAGVFAWVQQLRLGAEAMGPADPYQRALYAGLPGWYNWVYAVAVWGGLLGAIALLMRSKAVVPLFAASLVAILVQFGWLFATTDMVAVRGAGAVLPMPIAIAAIGVFQLWLARRAQARGWIA